MVTFFYSFYGKSWLWGQGRQAANSSPAVRLHINLTSIPQDRKPQKRAHWNLQLMIVYWRLITFLSKINEREPNPKSQAEREMQVCSFSKLNTLQHSTWIYSLKVCQHRTVSQNIYGIVKIDAMPVRKTSSCHCWYCDTQGHNQKCRSRRNERW
jgi:hypothetical protein